MDILNILFHKELSKTACMIKKKKNSTKRHPDDPYIVQFFFQTDVLFESIFQGCSNLYENSPV